jgi:hypothetical protein
MATLYSSREGALARAASPAPKCGNELWPKADAHLPPPCLSRSNSTAPTCGPYLQEEREGWPSPLDLSVRVGSKCENLAVSKCFLLNLDKLTLLITIASTESGQLIPIGSRN